MNDSIVRCPQCGTRNRVPDEKKHLRPKCGRCGSVFQPAGHGNVVELNDSNFDSIVLQAALPVLVDFYSPTCGPCHILAPTIDNMARKFAGSAIIAKLDTSRYQLVAGRYQVRGVPTLIFFNNGQVISQIVGAAPADQIEYKIRSML